MDNDGHHFNTNPNLQELQAWFNSTQETQVREIPNFFSKSPFGRTSDLKKAASFFVVFATVAVVLRMFSRHRHKTRMGWDDICIIAAIFFLVTNQTVFALIDFLGSTSFSFFGIGPQAEEMTRLGKIVLGLKLSLVFEVMYLISIFLVRFSMLFLYERFARHTKYITIYLRITQGICATTFAVCILSLFLSCIPISMFWELGNTNQNCSRRELLTYTSGVSNIITNTLVLAVPVPLLFRANLTMRQRVGVSVLYFFGGFVIMASAFRFATEILNVSVPQAIGWSQIEVSLAVILACAPMAVKMLYTPLIDPDVEPGKNMDTKAIIMRLTNENGGMESYHRMEDYIPEEQPPNKKAPGLKVDTVTGNRQSRIVREINSPDYQKLRVVRAEVNGQSVWEVRPKTPSPPL